MRTLIQAVLIAATLAMSPAWADDASPVGMWKNIDDVSGKPKALIRITETNGVLQGRLEKLFRAPEQEQNPLCDKCEGLNKDKPILGLLFMWGLKKMATSTPAAKSSTRTMAKSTRARCA